MAGEVEGRAQLRSSRVGCATGPGRLPQSAIHHRSRGARLHNSASIGSKQLDLYALPTAARRLLVVFDGLSALHGQPLQPLPLARRAIRLQCKRVGIDGLHHVIEARDDLLGQFRTIDDQTDLGVEMQRSLVEIH
jgi:hypothetical protein